MFQIIYLLGQTVKPTLDLDNYKRGLSPQVALINRFDDYPVDLQYGLVDISVPLYTIQTNAISIPFELKFHASGLRADEQEGLLGIRWALAGGGQVTRIIKGYPDEMRRFNSNVSATGYAPSFYDLFGTTGSHKELSLNTLGNNSVFLRGYWTDSKGVRYNYYDGYKDTEYDIFTYTLPNGKSGKFILEDIAGVKTARLMPFEPLKISVDVTIGININEITITDEDGTTYVFGGVSTQTTQRYIDTNFDGWATTWHLTSISSANQKYKVVYEYKRCSKMPQGLDNILTVSDRLDPNHSPWYTPVVILLDPLFTPTGSFGNCFKSITNFTNLSNYYPYYLESVTFSGEGNLIGNLNFNYENDSYGNPKYLKNLSVLNSLNDSVKSINFRLKDNGSKNLKYLDKIEYKSISHTTKEVYQFDYYDSSTVPACGELVKNSDWWGYYSNGGGLLKYDADYTINIPDEYYSNSTTYKMPIPGGNKLTDLGSMEIGMIKKIHYPTGGTSEFIYECNKYGVNNYCGGLRIQKIIKTPYQGKTEVRRYEYGTPVMSYLPTSEKFNVYTENEIYCYARIYDIKAGQLLQVTDEEGEAMYMQQTYQNTFPSRYTDFHSNVAYYPSVTEYIESGSGVSCGKTVYVYSSSAPQLDFYEDLNGNIFQGSYNYMHGYMSPTDFWVGNKLKSKTIYDNTLTHKVKDFIYDYDIKRIKSVYDMPVFRYRLYNILYAGDMTSMEDKDTKELLSLCSSDGPEEYKNAFAIKHQKYTIGVEKLSKITENTYNSDGSTTTVVQENVYDPLYTMLVQQKITNSDGITTRTDYEYPFNTTRLAYDQFDDNLYEKMANSKNILTPIITKQVITLRPEATEVVDNTTKDYFEYSKGIYYPASMENTTTNTTINYNNYTSNGMPQYLLKNNTENVVFLWSYNQQYPIAEIKNATFDQVAIALGGDVLGGETKINEIANKLIPTSSDLILVNGLRTSPSLPQAQVNTYTYAPLIGRTSATDPRGITTFFEYDGMGRLKDIYRLNGSNKEIINHYEYNYAQQ
jgi:YD repeat-containing protein